MKQQVALRPKPVRAKISYIAKAKPSVKPRHLLTGAELSRPEINLLLEHARLLKNERRARIVRQSMRGCSMALLLEKPSLRTKFSFSVAMQELGGLVVESLAGQRKSETPEDTARVLSGYCHVLVVRTFSQANLERMAKVSAVPVINALSDEHHPCQILADLLTLKERFGELRGLKVAYIGDGNNILHSLLLLLPFMGIDLHFACPEGYQPDPSILFAAHERAAAGGGGILSFSDPKAAVAGVNAIYTDVWTSMGFESGAENRESSFEGYQLNENLYSLADRDAVVMHCMPMVRNKEISDSMADHPNAVLFSQSENRLHVQKALLDLLKI